MINLLSALVPALGAEGCEVTVRYWPDLAALQAAYPTARFVYTSKKAAVSHVGFAFQPGDFLVFGKETEGLPEELLAAHPENCVRIPIFTAVRSLNLSTATGIVLYEALRQTGRLTAVDGENWSVVGSR